MLKIEAMNMRPCIIKSGEEPESVYIYSARHNTIPLVVTADGVELGRCNLILTHDGTGLHSIAGNTTGVFIGDDARKIVLNWEQI